MAEPNSNPENQNTSDLPFIRRLVELQGDETDDRFARRWLGISGTTWYRLKQNDYQANPETVLHKCEGGLQALEDYLAYRERNGNTGKILRLSIVRQVLDAIKVANAAIRDRLVLVLTPTGGGKSWTAMALKEQYPGRICITEATEPWRKSYLAACLSLAESLKLQDVPTNNRLAEKSIIDELTSRPRIVVIDESHYFGPGSINLVKAILNLTQSTVVLLAIPPLWGRLKSHAWEEAEQLRSRTAATIEMREIGLKDLKIFIEDRLPKAESDLNSDYETALAKIQTSANRFGLWDTIELITTNAREEANGQPLTLNIITSVIALVEKIRR